MKMNLPTWLRKTIYTLNVLGTPVMGYLAVTGVIGELELGLWAAEMTAAFALANLNTPTKE